MNSLLPNMRLVCLLSEDLGRDWNSKEESINRYLSQEGLNLSEETVYLLFSESPKDSLMDKGQCLIARPVIGPKKTPETPFRLIDWTLAPVWRGTLQGETLSELLESAEKVKNQGETAGNRFGKSFFLCIKRRLDPGLKLSVEGIFHE